MARPNLILKHLSVWIIYLIVATLTYGYKQNDWGSYAYETTVSLIVSSGIFYLSVLFIFPRFWEKKKYTQAITLLLLLLVSSVFIRFELYFRILPFLFKKEFGFAGLGTDELTVRFAFQWFIFTLYAVIYWPETAKIKLQQKLAEQNKEITEKEKLQLENAALRAQINPHFIFNTLDPLRVRTAEILPEVSQCIGNFMQIIRANITSPGPDGKIPFDIELNAIEATIAIYRLRYPNLCLSHITNIKDEDSVRILPHILTPFVDNAFKHGVLDDKNNKVKIELYVNRTNIELSVSNKKNVLIKDATTGIGLKYILRNLDAGYHRKHKLIVNETAEDYSVSLSVQLN